MKDKPLIFNLLSIFFIIVSISIPMQIAYLYGHLLSEYQMIWHKLTFLNLAVIVISIVNAWYCFFADNKLKISIPASIILVALNNWTVSRWGTDYSEAATLASTFSFALISSTIIFSKANDIIANPSFRWWKIPLRIKNKIPLSLCTKDHSVFKLRSFDFSKSGAFISLENESFICNKILSGEDIEISVPMSGEDIVLKAKVVRKSIHKKGLYPAGIGIQFLSKCLKDKENINKILAMPALN